MAAGKHAKQVIVGLIVLLCGTLVAGFLGNERNRYAVTSAKGSIIEGEQFGIHVGDRLDHARRVLEEKGFREVITPSQAKDMGYPHGNEYVFVDRGWRSGIVWVTESNGIVTRIGWRYDLWASLP